MLRHCETRRSYAEYSGSGDRCTTDVTKPPHNKVTAGSIYGVGGRFQSFRINDLEMVGLTGIEPLSVHYEQGRSP